MENELKCSVCKGVITELRQTLLDETPKQNLDLRAHLSSDGKRKGKVVEWKASESRASDMLEEVCAGMKQYVLMEKDDDNNRSGRRGYFKPSGSQVNMLPYFKDIKKTATTRQNMRIMCQAIVEEHEETLAGFLSQEPSRLRPIDFCMAQSYCVEGVDSAPAGTNDGRFQKWDALALRFATVTANATARQGVLAELEAALAPVGGPFLRSGRYYLRVMRALHEEELGGAELHEATPSIASARFLKQEVASLVEQGTKGGGSAGGDPGAPSAVQRLAIAAQFGDDEMQRSAEESLWEGVLQRAKATGALAQVDDEYWDQLPANELLPKRTGRTAELERVAAVFATLPTGSSGQVQLLRLVGNASSACTALGACDAALVPRYAAIMAQVAEKGVQGVKKDAKKLQTQMRKRRKHNSAKAQKLRSQTAEKVYIFTAFLGDRGDDIADAVDDHHLGGESAKDADIQREKWLASEQATGAAPAPMRLRKAVKPGRIRALDGIVRRWHRARLLFEARKSLVVHLGDGAGPGACDEACATTDLGARRRELATKASAIVDKLEAGGKLSKSVAEHDARAHVRAMRNVAAKGVARGDFWLVEEMSRLGTRIMSSKDGATAHLLKRQRWICRALGGDWKASVLREMLNDEVVCKDGHCLA